MHWNPSIQAPFCCTCVCWGAAVGSCGSSWFVLGGRCLVLDLSWITATDWMQLVSSLFCFQGWGSSQGLSCTYKTHTATELNLVPSSILSLDHTGFLPLVYVCEVGYFMVAVFDTVWKLGEQDLCAIPHQSLKDSTTLYTHPVSELLCYLRIRILFIQMTPEFWGSTY